MWHAGGLTCMKLCGPMWIQRRRPCMTWRDRTARAAACLRRARLTASALAGSCGMAPGDAQANPTVASCKARLADTLASTTGRHTRKARLADTPQAARLQPQSQTYPCNLPVPRDGEAKNGNTKQLKPIAPSKRSRRFLFLSPATVAAHAPRTAGHRSICGRFPCAEAAMPNGVRLCDGPPSRACRAPPPDRVRQP